MLDDLIEIMCTNKLPTISLGEVIGHLCGSKPLRRQSTPLPKNYLGKWKDVFDTKAEEAECVNIDDLDIEKFYENDDISDSFSFTSSNPGSNVKSNSDNTPDNSFYFQTPSKPTPFKPFSFNNNEKIEKTLVDDAIKMMKNVSFNDPKVNSAQTEDAFTADDKAKPLFSIGVENDINFINKVSPNKTHNVRKGARARRTKTPLKSDTSKASDADPINSTANTFSGGVFWGEQVNLGNLGESTSPPVKSNIFADVPPVSPPPAAAPFNDVFKGATTESTSSSSLGMFAQFVFSESSNPVNKNGTESPMSIDGDGNNKDVTAAPTSAPLFNIGVEEKDKSKMKAKIIGNTKSKPGKLKINKNSSTSDAVDNLIPVPPAPSNGQTMPPSAPSSSSTSAEAEYFRKQGKEYYNADNYTAAYDAYSLALSNGSSDWSFRPAVYGNRAAALMMLGRYIEAIDDCTMAVREDPTLIKLHCRKGRAFIKLGQLGEAEEAYSRVMEFSSTSISSSSVKSSRQQQEIEVEIEQCKGEAKQGLKQVSSLKGLLVKLDLANVQNDHSQMLAVSQELLEVCPHMKEALVYRVRALNKLTKFNDAKLFAEQSTCAVHSSLAQRFAHPLAAFPTPLVSMLTWKDNASVGGGPTVAVNVEAIKAVLLCMGPDMAREYVQSLKNTDVSRNCCAASMRQLDIILTGLIMTIISNAANSSITSNRDWDWLNLEAVQIRKTLEYKEMADVCFNQKRHVEAARNYGEALKIDNDAIKWHAILLSNRAAAYMNDGKFEDAITDCHAAILKDSTFMKAVLRRARAYAALEQYAASIRDYRTYINHTDPVPGDRADIELEMNKVNEMQIKKLREDQKRQERSFYGGRNPHQGSAGRGRGGGARNRTWRDLHPDGSDDDNYFFRSFQSRGGRGGGGGSRQYYNYRNSGTVSSDESESEDEFIPPPSFAKKEPDLYNILGVEATATERDIKTSYRKLALKYHPDKNKEPGAEDMFKTITSAYAVLVNKESRDKYDRTRPINARRR